MENIDKTRAKLTKYLAPLTRYKETSDEIFDHVLRKLELEAIPFSEGYVQQIIEDDFGGSEGIRMIQQGAILATKNKISKKYWEEFRNILTTKKLFSVIVIAMVWFFISKNGNFNHSKIIPGIAAIIAVWGFPLCFSVINAFKAKALNEKPSLFRYLLSNNSIIIRSVIVLFFSVALITKGLLPLTPIQFGFIFAFSVVLISIDTRIFTKLHDKKINLQTA